MIDIDVCKAALDVCHTLDRKSAFEVLDELRELRLMRREMKDRIEQLEAELINLRKFKQDLIKNSKALLE